jgi:K+-sensing histidine kinase KdpD
MIDAYAGEPNQVWTNLINDAVDAMRGSGTLRVTTRVENGEVVIEVGDTGPGIPRRWPRAFEAFIRQRTLARAPAWVLTLCGALLLSATAARSASTHGRARPRSGSRFRFIGLSKGDRDYSPTGWRHDTRSGRRSRRSPAVGEAD